MKLAVAIAIDEVALRARVERALAGWLQARPATLEVVLTDATGLREAPRPGPGRELVPVSYTHLTLPTNREV